MRLLELRADAQKFAQALEVTESASAKWRENCQTNGSDVTAHRAFGSHSLTIPKQI